MVSEGAIYSLHAEPNRASKVFDSSPLSTERLYQPTTAHR
jgi:hypothetical protein